ncbi:hypothetical protein SELMODRAFT_445877 [Selaginella moellendorffii]|uniref:Uncharacterized protein n=1 Tax=Selaginella moellendorffii TaxID=88036 RepID=D8SM12_SELML|nr:uncharacterized protein LOC9644073 [Selaginella moellendorffii]EFJ14521.1 hypothetical protein SELMODRAFT_445877 [Selaginella moellendorffii]|eukprot:XP_002984471.1 uncharacterized protein LOC9644073 [Selaginella moellendorffii]
MEVLSDESVVERVLGSPELLCCSDFRSVREVLVGMYGVKESLFSEIAPLDESPPDRARTEIAQRLASILTRAPSPMAPEIMQLLSMLEELDPELVEVDRRWLRLVADVNRRYSCFVGVGVEPNGPMGIQRGLWGQRIVTYYMDIPELGLLDYKATYTCDQFKNPLSYSGTRDIFLVSAAEGLVNRPPALLGPFVTRGDRAAADAFAAAAEAEVEERPAGAEAEVDVEERPGGAEAEEERVEMEMEL